MSTKDTAGKEDDNEVSVCANCGKGEEESHKLKICNACKMVKYCNTSDDSLCPPKNGEWYPFYERISQLHEVRLS